MAEQTIRDYLNTHNALIHIVRHAIQGEGARDPMPEQVQEILNQPQPMPVMGREEGGPSFTDVERKLVEMTQHGEEDMKHPQTLTPEVCKEVADVSECVSEACFVTEKFGQVQFKPQQLTQFLFCNALANIGFWEKCFTEDSLVKEDGNSVCAFNCCVCKTGLTLKRLIHDQDIVQTDKQVPISFKPFAESPFRFYASTFVLVCKSCHHKSEVASKIESFTRQTKIKFGPVNVRKMRKQAEAMALIGKTHDLAITTPLSFDLHIASMVKHESKMLGDAAKWIRNKEKSKASVVTLALKAFLLFMLFAFTALVESDLGSLSRIASFLLMIGIIVK